MNHKTVARRSGLPPRTGSERQKSPLKYLSANKVIEIGAEEFAAEFIYPEAEMRALATSFEIALELCTPEMIVNFRRACSAQISYTFIVKRSERFGFCRSVFQPSPCLPRSMTFFPASANRLIFHHIHPAYSLSNPLTTNLSQHFPHIPTPFSSVIGA